MKTFPKIKRGVKTPRPSESNSRAVENRNLKKKSKLKRKIVRTKRIVMASRTIIEAIMTYKAELHLSIIQYLYDP